MDRPPPDKLYKFYEPLRRSSHVTVEVGGKVYACAGWDNSGQYHSPSLIEVFDPETGLWHQQPTTGEIPSSVCGCAYATIGSKIYVFGGWDGSSWRNSLHELDLSTMVWREVRPRNLSDGPQRKSLCGMVAYGDNRLVIFGGYIGSGCTDELHVFNLKEGTWSSPRVSGTPPPRCRSFTLTKIDEHHAVMFGGFVSGHDLVNDVYILDMQNWHWMKVSTSGPSSPNIRQDHAACYIAGPLLGSLSPQLFVTGGLGDGLSVRADAWVLDLQSKTWMKVDIPDGVSRRLYHTLTVVSSGPTSVQLVEFGGCRQFGGVSIAATAILQLEVDKDQNQAGGPVVWRVADVATTDEPQRWKQRLELLQKLKPATTSDTSIPHQDKTKLHEEEKEAKEIQQKLESEQAKEISEVKGEYSAQKAASESLQEQLVESEWRAREAERESQKANQQLQLVQRKRDELAAAVELRDKQLDWERLEREALNEYKRAHHQLQLTVLRQERELELSREENAQILDHQTTHKHDPTYPGVCFFGDQLQESVDSSGRLIQWPQVGITLDIPPGAVPSGEVLYLSIWPCLSGPYVLPPGWELVSPAYLIKPAFHFKKPVKLSLAHFARLSTDEDCDEMTFVSAQFSPETTGKKPEYHFRSLDKGSFRQGENVGTICVTHFCAPAVARKQKRKQIPSKRRKDADLERSVFSSVEYSILLYHNKSIPYKHDGYSVFAVSLCHALYLENLSKDIKEQFPGIQFWLFQKHRVQMTGDAVEVEYPQAVGRWRIEPDRKPLKISQKDVDLPNYHPELSRSKEHYPPRMLLTITSPQEGAEDAKCSLRVVGVSEHVEFLMQLKREKQPESSEALTHSLPHSSTSLGERPTLRMLLAFPAREGMLNIPDMIGTSYTQLGIFLLEDDEGAKVEALENQYRDNAMKINIEILKEWIRGRGKQPVIWRTLAEVLRVIGLKSLADSIAVVK